MIKTFEGSGSIEDATDEANKFIKSKRGKWKPIQFETVVQSENRMLSSFSLIVLFEIVDQL